MSHTTTFPARANDVARPPLVSIDLIVAAVFVAIYAITIHLFEYKDALAESDLYRVLVGLLDGAVSGAGLQSDLHYDRSFGLGYLAAFYTFADHNVLRDPDRLMALMNQVGYWSMLAGLAAFWAAVRLVHGALAATLALIIFALGPMTPELATSGHQVLPMFAFLCAGAVLLFLPLSGWRAVLAAAAGGILLLGGLTMRGEIFLAFPWLVLSRADTTSFRRFVASALLRSIAPTAALVGFVVLQRQVDPAASAAMGSTVGDYFTGFYSWATAAPGIMYMMLGCGIATVIAAAVAGGYAGSRLLFARKTLPPKVLAEYLGALALILTPLAFFLPNPMPTRHFMMTLAGLGILIGMTIARRPALGRVAALGIVLAIGVANQVCAELVRAPLLRMNEAHSPYLPVYTEYPTATHANLGWEWRRHEALVEKRARWQAFGNEIRTSCDAHLIVFSDEAEQLFSRLYAGGTPVQARRVFIDIGDQAHPQSPPPQLDVRTGFIVAAPRLIGLEGIRAGKTVLMLDKSHAWPQDAVATILADPAYADYRLVADPYTLSRFDRTPIPADRAARFGCPAPAS